MTERQQHEMSGRRTANRDAPHPGSPDVWREQTIPRIPVVRVVPVDQPSILGFPAEIPADDLSAQQLPADQWGAREWEPAAPLVVLRRPDVLAALLLLLAGMSAALSLWLPWIRGDADSGLFLVRRGLDALRSGAAEVARTGLWQPLALVLGGAALFLLGLLLFVPARTHRFVGLLALIVALAAAAAVVTLLARAGWHAPSFALGMWFAAAVPALGLLGALKAMLTVPRVTTQPR
jgi:hypothetical protein